MGDSALPGFSLVVGIVEPIPKLTVLKNDAVELERYQRKLGSGIDAFYDWLRTKERKIVGIRFTSTNDETDVLVNAVPSLSYAVKKPREVEIFFGKARNYAPEQSSDQAFGRSGLLVDAKGSYSFIFDLYSLNEGELAQIRKFVR